MSFGRYWQFGFCDPEAIYGLNENLPGEAFTLATSSVQPFECTFNPPPSSMPDKTPHRHIEDCRMADFPPTKLPVSAFRMSNEPCFLLPLR